MARDDTDKPAPEVWIIPVQVFDEVTARDTAQVLVGMGYLTGNVYKEEASA